MDNTVRLWTLLSKQQAGALSSAETLELEELQKDSVNRKALAAYASLDGYWKKIAAEKGVDTDKYWQAHAVKLQNTLDFDLSADSTEPFKSNFPSHKLWYKKSRLWVGIAAAILLVFGLTLIFRHTINTGIDVHIVVHNGDQKQLILPDGSKVWLNSGSELSYNKNFADAPLKEIYLKGEAFFDIEHNPNRIFIIHTKYLDIKDIGTRFNVKAYEDEDKMETTLIKGAVEVYPKNHPERMIRLRPNEKVVYDTKILRSGKLQKDINDAKPTAKLHLDSIESHFNGSGNSKPSGFYIAKIKPQVKAAGDSIFVETAWMQHQLAFSAQTFAELAKNMERRYDVQIEFENDRVANYIFSGIFKGESLQEALSELQMIQPFHYETGSGNVRIY